jgi:hypothetical protein
MQFGSRPVVGARQYLFAVLSFLVLVLSVDVLGLTEVGDPKASGMVVLIAWAALVATFLAHASHQNDQAENLEQS